MVAAAGHRIQRWAYLVVGWCLVAVGVALHVAAAAEVAAVDPLADVVAFVLHHGWVRVAAWAAVTGGACLVVAGWSRRSTSPVDPEQS